MSEVDEIFGRCIPMLGKDGIEKLNDSTVAIAGLGGVGGAIAVTLTRLGIGKLKIADPGTFDEPDINRQWAANRHTLGRNKAEVYADLIKSINNKSEITVVNEGVNDKNINEFIERADIVIDGLDVKVDIGLRTKLFQTAYDTDSYCITSPIICFGGFFAMSEPGGQPLTLISDQLAKGIGGKLPQVFHAVFPSKQIETMEQSMDDGLVPSLAVAPNIVASIAGTEVIVALLQGQLIEERRPLVLPNVAMIDFYNLNIVKASLEMLVT